MVTGDITQYTAARARPGIARVWFVDADSGRALGRVTVSGRRGKKSGDRFDAGFVQTALCRPTAGGRSAKVYLGGSFTRVLGSVRRRTAMVEVTPRGDGLRVRVDRWQLPSAAAVSDISAAPRQILVAASATLRSVSPSTAKVRWAVRGSCGGVRTALYAAGSVYVGGFFNSVQGPDGSVSRNHGLARINARNGSVASRSNFRTRLAKNSRCTRYDGTVPLSLAHDTRRQRIVVCAGGLKNRLVSVDRRSGRQGWSRKIDGDGQVCAIVRDQVFVGLHRGGPNTVTDARGCGRFSCGTMGAFFRLSDGRQTRWLPPSSDFSGSGRNHDARNNGISGATVIGPWLVVAGGFTRIGSTPVSRIARFRIR
ncbi:MAG: hypothetical protein Q7T56_13540 [Nocardioidaceae bacterium]|nr:hypothetical protein [Nocardioidaceae bacterium]